MRSCQRLDEVLSEAATADALAHAKGCAECGPARAAWDGMSGPAAAPAASLDKLREAARAELKARPKPRMWWTDALLLLAVNLGIAAVGVLVLKARVTQPSLGVGAALAVLMGVGAWAAVRPGANLLRLGVLGVAAVAAVWAGLGGSGQSTAGSGLACALTECGLSMIPLAAALWITSRFAFDLTRALVGGLSVGATGMFVLHLHCMNGTTEHLLLFHVLPWLVIAMAAVVIRRMLPSRSYAS